MAALPKTYVTPDEYLEFERASPAKHEYIDGEIYAMSGGSENHSLIAVNTIASLHTQLRQRPCRVYNSDKRIRIPSGRQHFYPDVSVVCGPPQLADETQDMLLNPTLIIEVLSPSTESFDRGRKFAYYRTLPSLQEYVLISQDSVHVERFLRQGEQWLLADVSGLDGVMTLTSIDCVLLLADVYEKVAFEDAPGGDTAHESV